MLVDAFVILGSLLVAAVALTQILIPLIQNKPLFASFRKRHQREKYLKEQLEETQRRLAELELEKQLAERRRELVRRQTEELESLCDLTPPFRQSECEVNSRKESSEKEQ
jgi:hypothetical protein